MFNQEKHQEKIEMIEAQAAGKYDCAGLYSISIGDNLVYIGKSAEVKNRIGFHLMNIMDSDSDDYNSHKYEVLREAKERGLPISFDLIYKSEETDEEKIKEDIGYKEGEFIRKYFPPLNYQIPKVNNYKSFTVQKSAKTITLDEIMAQNS